MFYLLVLIGIVNAIVLLVQYLLKKHKDIKMYCLLGGDCEEVVTSKYGATLGIKNEIIGIGFYTILAGLKFKNQSFDFLSLVIVCISLIAFLFSIRLLFIQVFVLRKFCSWCLIAIAINMLIFLLTTGEYIYPR